MLHLKFKLIFREKIKTLTRKMFKIRNEDLYYVKNCSWNSTIPRCYLSFQCGAKHCIVVMREFFFPQPYVSKVHFLCRDVLNNGKSYKHSSNTTGEPEIGTGDIFSQIFTRTHRLPKIKR